MKRVATALVLIPLVVALIFQGPPLAVRAALTLVGLLCLRECFDLIEAGGARAFRPAGYAAGAVLILTSAPAGGLLVVFTALLLVLTLQQERHREALPAVAGTLFAVVYTCGAFALARRLHEADPHWLFAALLVNWAGDSAAMYAGRAFGRRKLAPTISPNKTWAGAVASVLLGGAAGAGYLAYFAPGGYGMAFFVVFALTANVAGQAGDLVESVLKRGAGVKDSGALLPGHGGMLDRMDGALFAFPAVYLLLTLASLSGAATVMP